MIGSVLIISRNNLSCTKVAVRSALNQDVPCDVLIFDNGSTDGTLHWLRTKPIRLMSPTSQLSLAACWNYGIKAFRRLGATEVLVCNNDIELRSDAYRMLLGLNLPFVTCVSVDKREQLGSPCDRTWDDLLKSKRPHPDYSCFMIRSDVDTLFDESYYPAYAEDTDHHVRLHRAGVEAVCVDLPFLHLGAQTLKNASEGEQARIRRGADANREKFRKKYGCLPGSLEYQNLFV